MRLLGIGLVVFAAVFWGISGGITNILMDRGWDPIVIAFYRGFVGFLCFFLVFFYHIKLHWIFSVRLFFWSFLAGLGIAGNFTFYAISIQGSSISVAVTLMYTAPVFVFLISFLLGIERSTCFKWGCIFIVVIGIMLLTGAYKADSVSVTFPGLAAGLASALSYALFIFGFKNACSIGMPQSILSIAFLSFCMVLLLFMDTSEAVRVFSSQDMGLFFLLGILGAGISFVFYVIGIRWIAPTEASLVAMIEPVTASLFGILFLGDYLTFAQFVGMGLILATITLLSIRLSGKNHYKCCKEDGSFTR